MSQPLKFDITADTDNFAAGTRRVTQGINDTERAASGFAKNLNGYFSGLARQMAGFFGAQFLLQKSVQQFSDAGAIRDKSTALGVGIEKYQEYGFIAAQTAARIEDFEVAIKTTARTQLLALKGNDDLIATFSRLGVSMDQLRSKTAPQLFDQIASKQKGVTDASLLVGDAMKVMGESATKVLPGMITGFDDLAMAAHKAGAVIDRETVLSLADTGDRLTTLGFQFKAFAAPFVDFFSKRASEILDLTRMFTESYWEGAKSFYKQLSNYDANGPMDLINAFMSGIRESDNKIIDERIKRELALKAAIEARRKIAEAANAQPNGNNEALLAIGDNKAPVAKEEKKAFDNRLESVDVLQKIGLFRGPTGDSAIPLIKEQTGLLRELSSNQRESNRYLKELAD